MRHGKDDRVRGTAAQTLLERGWGKPRVEVATTHKSDSESFIEALQEVAERVKERQAWEHGIIWTSTPHCKKEGGGQAEGQIPTCNYQTRR